MSSEGLLVFRITAGLMPERSPGGVCAAAVSSCGGSLPVCFGVEESFPVGIKGAEDVLNGAVPISGFENDVRVAVVGFDFGGLDSLVDLGREALAGGEVCFGEFVEGLAAERVLVAECVVVERLVGLLLGKVNKGLAVYAVADACGLLSLVGLSQVDVARRLGVSKQNVQNMSEEFARKLGLRQTRTHRGEVSRGRMRLSNFRPTKRNAHHHGGTEGTEKARKGK